MSTRVLSHIQQSFIHALELDACLPACDKQYVRWHHRAPVISLNHRWHPSCPLGSSVITSRPIVHCRGISPTSGLLLRLPETKHIIPILFVFDRYSSDRSQLIFTLLMFRWMSKHGVLYCNLGPPYGYRSLFSGHLNSFKCENNWTHCNA